MEHTCKTCGYTTKVKASFESHLRRKRPCKPKVAEAEPPPSVPKADQHVVVPPEQKGRTCFYCDTALSETASWPEHVCECNGFKVRLYEVLSLMLRMQHPYIIQFVSLEGKPK
jgi:hypothetical protein